MYMGKRFAKVLAREKNDGGKTRKKGSVIDRYRSICVAWMLKKKSKLILNVVGHVPCEISRFI